jgi:primosomal protein N' (replication factor Y)
MTYHKAENRMRCHFCGASLPVPRLCPACHKPFVKYFGVGTEQVEEQLRELFPAVKTLRMDTDTMRQKGRMQEHLQAFAAGEAQVLIGTQMIAKGHDFPEVTLVGVISADAALRIPDYRSSERCFQLLTQVSGRAGRDKSPGRVIVQTYSPGHPAIRFAKEHDYKRFFAYELAERRKGVFPPYSLFIRVLFVGTDEAMLASQTRSFAEGLESALQKSLGEEGKKALLLYCASEAPIRRLQGQYRYQVLIKLLRTKETPEAIRTVYDFADHHRNDLFALVEVNPQDML